MEEKRGNYGFHGNSGNEADAIRSKGKRFQDVIKSCRGSKKTALTKGEVTENDKDASTTNKGIKKQRRQTVGKGNEGNVQR